MKPFVIAFKFSIIAVLILAFVIILQKYDVKPAPPVVPDVQATQNDSVITAQMKRKIAKRDSLINALELKLTATTEKVGSLKSENKGLKAGNDSLSKFYCSHHNLQTCDSLVIAKQVYIDGLEQENDSLDSEAEQYSRLLYVERGKSADKDTLIGSKERLIVAYKQQFSRINCMDDWTAKHKFWSWLLGIKCR